MESEIVGGMGVRAILPSRQDAWDSFADAARLRDFQAIVLRDLITAGEAFVVITVSRGRFGIVALDPATIDYEKGVEYDRDGNPIAYKVSKDAVETRYPADSVIHIFDGTAGYKRGVCPMASAFGAFDDLKAFQASVLRNASLTADNSIFWTRPENWRERDVVGDAAADGQGTQTYAQLSGRTATDRAPNFRKSALMRIGEEPVLPFGFEAHTLNRGAGFAFGSDYTQISRSIVARIAAGLGISYGTLSGETGDANFSSLRAARLADIGLYSVYQGRIVFLMRRIYRAWRQYQASVGGVVMPEGVRIVAPAFAPVDSVKERTAERIALESGTVSPQRIIETEGLDPADIANEIREWRTLAGSEE